MIRRVVAAALLLLACPSDAGTPGSSARVQTQPSATTAATAATADPTPSTATPPAPECPADDRFAGLDWAPPSRLAIHIDRRAPMAAAALATSPTKLEGLGLPVYAEFDLKQLPFAVTTVEQVAARLQLSPASLMLLHGPDGRALWAMPANCDTAALEPLATAAWGLRFRNQGGARVANASGDVARPMPFDIIIVQGELVVLAPAGSTASITRWLRGGSAALDDLTRVRAGEALAKLRPAALQMRIEGPGLAGQGTGTARAFLLSDATTGWLPVPSLGD